MKSILVMIIALFIGVQYLAAQEKATQKEQPAKSAQTDQQAQPAKSTQAVQPAQPAKTTETAQPVKSSVVAKPAQAAQPAVPKTIAWNETVHDFGTVTQNKPATVTFTFKNTGESPVVVTTARSSCGCTVAEYTKEPVKPGGSGVVKATYNSAKAGSFTKTVSVTFEGNPTPDVLTIKGIVSAVPVATPNP